MLKLWICYNSAFSDTDHPLGILNPYVLSAPFQSQPERERHARKTSTDCDVSPEVRRGIHGSDFQVRQMGFPTRPEHRF